MIGYYMAGVGALLVIFALILVWDVVLWAVMDFNGLTQAESDPSFSDYVALYCGILGSCLTVFGLLGQLLHAIWAAL